jgi:hypothetical protein
MCSYYVIMAVYQSKSEPNFRKVQKKRPGTKPFKETMSASKEWGPLLRTRRVEEESIIKKIIIEYGRYYINA